MATHARIFYYAQRIGVQIDFSRYQDWLARHPDHLPPQVLPDGYLSPESSSSSSDHGQAEQVLPWQQAAPKADLYIDKSAPVADGAGAGDQPSYPMGFSQMLQLLQEGKPIPGIREIPNTIVRDPVGHTLLWLHAPSNIRIYEVHVADCLLQSVKPVGSRSAPKKPWERHAPQVASESSLPKALDTDFPPVDTEPAVSSPAADPVAS